MFTEMSTMTRYSENKSSTYIHLGGNQQSSKRTEGQSIRKTSCLVLKTYTMGYYLPKQAKFCH